MDFKSLGVIKVRLKIEVEHRAGRNAHVILQGITGEGTASDNADMLEKYFEICNAFMDIRPLQPSGLPVHVETDRQPLAASVIS